MTGSCQLRPRGSSVGRTTSVERLCRLVEEDAGPKWLLVIWHAASVGCGGLARAALAVSRLGALSGGISAFREVRCRCDRRQRLLADVLKLPFARKTNLRIILCQLPRR